MQRKQQGIDIYHRSPVAGDGLDARSRRMWIGGALRVAAAVAGMVASGAWGQRLATGVPERTHVTLAVANKMALAYLPLTVAEQLGYFRAEGLELQVQETASLARAQQMASAGTGSATGGINGGGADMVCGWLEHTLALQGKGQNFQVFVMQGRTPQLALGVSTKSMPDFKTTADLRGKKVGIAGPSTPSHTVAHAVLARAGLRLSEMAFVSVGSAAGALAALRSGSIDAVCAADPLITQLEQHGELRVVADTRSLRGTAEVFGGEIPSTCLYAPPEYVQKYPNTVQAVTNAMVHALKWLQTAGISDLMKIVPESYFAGDRALYLAAFARMREAIALDGVIPAAGVANTLAAMRNAEPTLRNETIDPAKCYTNTFALRAKQRFKV